MALITQYSRLSHHTIIGSASLTFSVPLTEDFTDGSWTPTDLALSEIGVNETSEKAYIRIGSTIKEFEFIGGSAGGEDLQTTLSIGNTTGPYDIVFDDTYGLENSNNTAYIHFDTTAGNEIHHRVDVGGQSTDVFHSNDTWSVKTNTPGNAVTINGMNFAYGTASTSGFTSSTLFTLNLPNTGDYVWIKAQVKGLDSTYTLGYSADMTAGFRNDGTGVYMIGNGYALIEYSDWGTYGAEAYMNISSNDIQLIVYGDTASNINWSGNINWG